MIKKVMLLLAILTFQCDIAHSASSLVFPKFKASDSLGAPLSGGKVYTYAPGTTTPKSTYTTRAGVTTNANPVILDSSGEATIFLIGAYKIVLKDANDVTQWTIDNVKGSDGYANFISVSDYADLSTAITSIGNTATTLMVDKACTISADETIPATLDLYFVRGGSISVDSGKTLTINGRIEAGNYQIFSCPSPTFTSTDGVIFGHYQDVQLEWFGGIGDGSDTTSNNPAFAAAINAITTSTGTIILSKGVYLIASNIYWKSYTNLYIKNGCQLKLKDAHADHIKMIDSATKASTYGNVQNVKIWSDGQGIIDANKAGLTDANNRSSCIYGTGTNWVIEGLIIRNASTNAGFSQGWGVTIDGQGGILDIQTVTIKNNRITGCESFGVVLETGTKVSIVDNLIDSGIDLEPDYSGYSAIRDTIISRNQVTGGGIGVVSAFPAILSRIIISDNIIQGAGIDTNDIRGLTITGNRIENGVVGQHSGVITVANNLNRKTETLTIDSAPAPAEWAAGATITGATSTKTAYIEAKISSTVYTISARTGLFTDDEVLSDGTNSRDCAPGYPQIYETDDIIIANNTLYNTTKAAGITDNYTAVILVWGYQGNTDNINISGNIIDTFDSDIGGGISVFNARHVVVNGNNLVNGKCGRGINVASDYATIANNNIDMSYYVTTTFPGIVSFSGKYSVISGNNCTFRGTQAIPAGINIYASDNITVGDDNQVLNIGSGSITNDTSISTSTNVYGIFYGTFTLVGAAASYNITSPVVRGTSSRVLLTPRNAGAASLQAGADALFHDSGNDIDATSFKLSTAGGGNAAGGEEFNYIIDTRK